MDCILISTLLLPPAPLFVKSIFCVMFLLLTILDGMGQCYTLLRDFISLQAVFTSSLFPTVSCFHGQAANRALGHTGILHQRVDSFNGPAFFFMLAGRTNLVRTLNTHLTSTPSGDETSDNCLGLYRRVSEPENLCDFTVPRVVFQVGWALHFVGSITSVYPYFSYCSCLVPRNCERIYISSRSHQHHGTLGNDRS